MLLAVKKYGTIIKSPYRRGIIMLRISNIKLSVTESEENLLEIVKKSYKIKEVKSFRISKKSIDARKKDNVFFVYSVDVKTDNDRKYTGKNAVVVEEEKYIFPECKNKNKKVVIAGAGPAGLMCALMLSRAGMNVTLLERGKCVEERKKDVVRFFESGQLDENSNIQFGEGGAGTFSDGKLTTGISDMRIKKVLEEFHLHGAPEEILYLSKPHVGTDNLYNMVRSIRNEIIKNGVEILFSTQFTDIVTENNTLKAVKIKTDNGESEIKADALVIATGHSARDTFEMLKERSVPMEKKAFSVGVRIEHSREKIDKSQYGDFYKYLGAADYKLSVHLESGRGVYTFCMCPGGEVIASASENGGVVTNGMSLYARDGENSNSALLVSVMPTDFEDDDVLSGMYFQREIEKKAFLAGGSNYKAPAQYVGDLLGEKCARKVKPTYRPGVVFTELKDILPDFVINAIKEAIPLLDKKLRGFADANAVLTAPETRSSSPVRILRDGETLQSAVLGIYPCGEGAGYAGGITSAAVDGIRVAEKIALSE